MWANRNSIFLAFFSSALIIAGLGNLIEFIELLGTNNPENVVPLISIAVLFILVIFSIIIYVKFRPVNVAMVENSAKEKRNALLLDLKSQLNEKSNKKQKTSPIENKSPKIDSKSPSRKKVPKDKIQKNNSSTKKVEIGNKDKKSKHKPKRRRR